jgi:hypothetical protein
MATTPFDKSRITVSEACNNLSQINAGLIDQLLGLRRRLAALQNAADLLKNSASNYNLPDLNRMVPAKDVGLDTYNKLKAACPDINLPNINGIADLNALYQTFKDAYRAIINALDTSPLGMLAQLEGQFISAIQDMLNSLGGNESLLHCLCQSENIYAQFPTWDQNKQNAIDTYKYSKGVVDGSENGLLNSNLKSKVQDLNNTKQLLTGLSEAKVGEVGSYDSASKKSTDLVSTEVDSFKTKVGF